MPQFTIQSPSGQPVTVEAPSQYEALGQVLGTAGPDVSELGSFGRGFTSMLPLGKQAYAGIAGLAENKPYTQERGELENELKQDVETNPGAHYAGQAAGIVAPIALTSGLAAPETVLGAAAQGGGIGGLFGAGNAADVLASGGSGAQAAGQVALGAGLGAAGGAAGQALGNLAGKGAQAFKESDIGQRLQASNVSKALGFNPRSLTALSKAENATPEQAAEEIFKDIQAIPGLPSNFLAPTTSVNDKLEMLKGLQATAGDTIGLTRDLGGKATAGNFPEGDQAINSLVTAAEGFRGIPDGTPENIKAVAAGLQALKDKQGLDFSNLSAYRSTVGEQVQKDVPGAKQVYRILSNHLDQALDRVGNEAGIDQAAFNAAKDTYHTTSRIMPLMQKGASREVAGAVGGLESAIGVGGMLTGHPAAALAPLAKIIPKLVAPEAMSNIALGGIPGTMGNVAAKVPMMAGSIAASQLIPETKAPTDLHLSHPAMAPWRQTFQANAARAQDPAEAAKANAVTDFTLSQRDPAYAAAKQRAAESPTEEAPKNMAEGGVVEPRKEDVKPDTSISPEAASVRTAGGKGRFNTQMEEQLKALLKKNEEK